MAKNRVVIDDRIWKRIRKELLKLDGAFTAVGFFSEDKYPEGTNIASIAFFNEFGTKNIPERSFIRAWIDKNKAKIRNFKIKLLDMLYKRRIDAKMALKLLGEFAQNGIKEEIIDIQTPGNAPSTIAKKGSSNPLIDTGRMLNSVRHKEFFKGQKPK